MDYVDYLFSKLFSNDMPEKSTLDINPATTNNDSKPSENNRKTIELVETTVKGEIIAENDKVVITNYNGALIVQEKYVKKKKVVRKVLVRNRRKGIITKETVVQYVTEKPVTIMIPENHADNPVEYLKSLEPRNRKMKSVINVAIKLLSP